MKILTLPYAPIAPQKRSSFQAEKTPTDSKAFDIFSKNTVQSQNTRFAGNDHIDTYVTARNIQEALRESETKPLNEAIHAGIIPEVDAVSHPPILAQIADGGFDSQKKKQLLSKLIKHGADIEKAKEYIRNHYRSREIPSSDNFPSSMFYHDPEGAQMYYAPVEGTSNFGYHLISLIDDAKNTSNWNPWGIIDTLTSFFNTKR